MCVRGEGGRGGGRSSGPRLCSAARTSALQCITFTTSPTPFACAAAPMAAARPLASQLYTTRAPNLAARMESSPVPAPTSSTALPSRLAARSARAYAEQRGASRSTVYRARRTRDAHTGARQPRPALTRLTTAAAVAAAAAAAAAARTHSARASTCPRTHRSTPGPAPCAPAPPSPPRGGGQRRGGRERAGREGRGGARRGRRPSGAGGRAAPAAGRPLPLPRVEVKVTHHALM